MKDEAYFDIASQAISSDPLWGERIATGVFHIEYEHPLTADQWLCGVRPTRADPAHVAVPFSPRPARTGPVPSRPAPRSRRPGRGRSPARSSVDGHSSSGAVAGPSQASSRHRALRMSSSDPV
ncbi:hypothetical protein GCM10023323_25200 [Streptomyces thinghirensis]|uniref:Uncharacterized protein n=1 Tax=Streptomyces thinghirensis TaxID=551547 RepID=A0ABP9T1L7_9ACTN